MQKYRSYIICGTPRSGSTMLCGLLSSAGCGRANSYFGPLWIPEFAEKLGVGCEGDYDAPEFNRRYLDAVLAKGKAGTDIFGLRIMFEDLENLSQRLDRLFPGLADAPARMSAAFTPPLYIHLSRRDKVAQAVSRLKADQTGLWHKAADGSELERTAPHRDATYDPDALGTLVEELERNDAGWRQWFATHGIEPVQLTYEGLAQDPQAGLRAVLAALGVDVERAANIKPKTAKLADSQSDAWAAEFHKVRSGRQGT